MIHPNREIFNTCTALKVFRFAKPHCSNRFIHGTFLINDPSCQCNHCSLTRWLVWDAIHCIQCYVTDFCWMFHDPSRNLEGFVNIEYDDRHHPSSEILLILSDMSFIKGILSYQICSWVPMTRPIFPPWFLQLRLVFQALWYSCGSTMDPIPWLREIWRDKGNALPFYHVEMLRIREFCLNNTSFFASFFYVGDWGGNFWGPGSRSAGKAGIRWIQIWHPSWCIIHPWEILINYTIRGHAGMVLQRCWGRWGTQS